MACRDGLIIIPSPKAELELTKFIHKSRHAQHRNFTWRCACGCVFSKAIRIDVVISRGHVIHAIIVLLACRGDSKPKLAC